MFPVSGSRGPYRDGGNGNGFFILAGGEAVAIGAVDNVALATERSESFAQGGGADAAALAQLLGGKRAVGLGHGEKDTL